MGLAGECRCFDTFQPAALAQSGEERDHISEKDRRDVQLDLIDESELKALSRDAGSEQADPLAPCRRFVRADLPEQVVSISFWNSALRGAAVDLALYKRVCSEQS